jgi:hypothetical protein
MTTMIAFYARMAVSLVLVWCAGIACTGNRLEVVLAVLLIAMSILAAPEPRKPK